MNVTRKHVERLARELDDIADGSQQTADEQATEAARSYHRGRTSSSRSAAAMVRGIADRYPDLTVDAEGAALQQSDERAQDLALSWFNGNRTHVAEACMESPLVLASVVRKLANASVSTDQADALIRLMVRGGVR